MSTTASTSRSSAAGAGSHRPHGHAAAGPRRTPVLAIGAGAAVLVGLAVWYFGSRGKEEPATASAAEAVKGVDLSKLPDQPPLEGTAEDEWASMNELVTRYITPPFGPTSVQAGDRLMIRGKRSVPAILNGFKRIDLATRDGAEIGWKVQTLLLQGLCNDTNFGWRRETRPQDVAFNQQVVQRWFEAWEYAGEDDERWAEVAKEKAVPSKAADAATEPPAASDG